MGKIKRHLDKYFLSYFYGVLCLAMVSNVFCTEADPLATAVKPQLEALFGPTSTISYAIYLAEIVVGAISYVKTKNLLVLIGVPILVIFTSAMFGYITPTS